ncbi:MAG TPA: NAD(P)H-dependent oxidoreductase [Burkholderiaceae bacterium]|nr:NAD(P)H-dependent oxidoreductase [Burkholderiaceae bacterium]
MKILHVSCSPRGQSSESYRLSAQIISFLRKQQPTALVIDRYVGGGALAHMDEDHAFALGASQPSPTELCLAGSIAQSEELIKELESADFVVIGTPMHNFTVSSGLKIWIDHVVRIRRTFNASARGKAGMLRDRPVFIAVSAGGIYSEPSARQPDFLTSYLKAILGMIGLHELHFFSVEGTAFGPQALANARAKAGQALENYFSSFAPCPQRRLDIPAKESM